MLSIALVLTTTSCLPAPEPGWDFASWTIAELVELDSIPMTRAAQDTQEICSGLDGCIEGWISDQAEITRFESNANAKKHAESLTDVYRWHRIVVDFSKGTTSPEEREWIIEYFEGINSWT
ncbi:hypothetical protein [Humidisolicoccus flavus]|uniref:hypothetical protein n=1 Tax=Humidisolicoccus flavus TaxID=3111414 RepID=UPI003255C7AC